MCSCKEEARGSFDAWFESEEPATPVAAAALAAAAEAAALEAIVAAATTTTVTATTTIAPMIMAFLCFLTKDLV